MTEQAPLYPQTDLAKSRAMAEALCYEWATLQDKTAYGLRPRFILGRNDRYVLPGLARLVEKISRWVMDRSSFQSLRLKTMPG